MNTYVLIFKTSNLDAMCRMLIANGNGAGDVLYYITVNIGANVVKVQRLQGTNDFRILYRKTSNSFEMYLAGRTESDDMGYANLSRTMLFNNTGELSDLENKQTGQIDESQFTIINVSQ